MKTINVRLLFPEPISARLVGISHDIASSFRLGPIPPHVTLFRFNAATAPALPALQCPVTLTGLQPLGDGADGLWVTIGVSPSEDLLWVRQELLKLCGNPALEREEFTPHITLGRATPASWNEIAARIGHDPLLRVADISCKADCVAF
jgi:2'-5' RNA ligase